MDEMEEGKQKFLDVVKGTDAAVQVVIPITPSNSMFLISLTIGEHKILIDPPPMTDEASSVILRNGPVDYIIVTNRDHAREAARYRDEFLCQLQVPEPDAPQMDLKPTKMFKDGELLTGGIW